MSKSISGMELVVNELRGMEGKFSDTLPKHIPSKQFLRTCVMAIQSNPDLLNCDRQSLYVACLKAAADGITIDSREGALVIFKNTVVYMPMVEGLIKKIRNTGELSSISAHVVHKNDSFRHVMAPVETIEHEGVALDEEPGEAIGVYAVAVLKSGEHQYCVMRKEQVMAIKALAKTKHIWISFADQMWEKTAIRRLCKRLPSSTELNRVFANDDETYSFDEVPTPPVKPAPVPAKKTQTRAAAAILKEKPEVITPEVVEESEVEEADLF